MPSSEGLGRADSGGEFDRILLVPRPGLARRHRRRRAGAGPAGARRVLGPAARRRLRAAADTVATPWRAEGRSGIDIRRGLSHTGANNAWARQTSGWHAIRQRVTLNAGIAYTLSGWIRTSDNVGAGYFGFRGTDQRPVAETRFGPLPATAGSPCASAPRAAARTTDSQERSQFRTSHEAETVAEHPDRTPRPR